MLRKSRFIRLILSKQLNPAQSYIAASLKLKDSRGDSLVSVPHNRMEGWEGGDPYSSDPGEPYRGRSLSSNNRSFTAGHSAAMIE
jgi:hypothetical protein